MRSHRYAHLIIDSVDVSVGLGEDSQLCLLVVRSACAKTARRELAAVEDDYRESDGSWSAAFRDLCDRAAGQADLVTGDGTLGAWAVAAHRVSRRQGAALLDSQHSECPRRAPETAAATGKTLHEMAEADTGPRAQRRGSASETSRPKYPKAVAELDEDWDMLTACDFPDRLGCLENGPCELSREPVHRPGSAGDHV